VPHGGSLEDLRPLLPVFLSYVLSFVYVGIYWNNHHHMLHTCGAVTGGVLWANLHLLFWLSLFPFTTGWMGENHFTVLPHGALWGGVIDGRDRVLHSATGDHPGTGIGFNPEKSDRQRLEGHAIAGDVSGSDHRHTAFGVDRPSGFRSRCIGLADPRQAY
jgi:hypothetical protein